MCVLIVSVAIFRIYWLVKKWEFFILMVPTPVCLSTPIPKHNVKHFTTEVLHRIIGLQKF